MFSLFIHLVGVRYLCLEYHIDGTEGLTRMVKSGPINGEKSKSDMMLYIVGEMEFISWAPRKCSSKLICLDAILLSLVSLTKYDDDIISDIGFK